MIRVEKAVDRFNNGYQCSQAILETFSEEFGLDKEQAIKMASPFGGGIALFGDKCGAITASLLIIGLKFGSADVEDKETRDLVYQKSHEFVDKFSIIHQSIDCRDLLGFDFSTPEGDAAIHDQNLCDKLCPNFVRTAARILETMMSE